LQLIVERKTKRPSLVIVLYIGWFRMRLCKKTLISYLLMNRRQGMQLLSKISFRHHFVCRIGLIQLQIKTAV
jgi:hypothetical protein